MGGVANCKVSWGVSLEMCFRSGNVSTRAAGRHSALFHSQQVSNRFRGSSRISENVKPSSRKFVIHVPGFATEMLGRITRCFFFYRIPTWNPKQPLIKGCFNWMMNQIFT